MDRSNFKDVISDCRCKNKADIIISKIEDEDIRIDISLKNKSGIPHFCIYLKHLQQMIDKFKDE